MNPHIHTSSRTFGFTRVLAQPATHPRTIIVQPPIRTYCYDHTTCSQHMYVRQSSLHTHTLHMPALSAAVSRALCVVYARRYCAIASYSCSVSTFRAVWFAGAGAGKPTAKILHLYINASFRLGGWSSARHTKPMAASSMYGRHTRTSRIRILAIKSTHRESMMNTSGHRNDVVNSIKSSRYCRNGGLHIVDETRI